MVPGEPVPDLAALIAPRPAWMADALCREHPQVVFVLASGQSAAAAKAICSRCAVVDECLNYAVEYDERGVWGATPDRERRAMRRAA